MNIRVEMDGKVYEGVVSESSMDQQSKPYAEESIPVIGSIGETEQAGPPATKRVVRSPKTGDKVYMIDEEQSTKKWVKSPEMLEELGFGFSDVQDITDEVLAKYRLVI
jgi:hypothetical protein